MRRRMQHIIMHNMKTRMIRTMMMRTIVMIMTMMMRTMMMMMRMMGTMRMMRMKTMLMGTATTRVAAGAARSIDMEAVAGSTVAVSMVLSVGRVRPWDARAVGAQS